MIIKAYLIPQYTGSSWNDTNTPVTS